jgi:hypothetical protein
MVATAGSIGQVRPFGDDPFEPGHACSSMVGPSTSRCSLKRMGDSGSLVEPATHSSLAVLEILDHVLNRLAADMNGTHEGMIDRHNHK